MSAFVAVNQCRLCVDFSFLFYTRRLLEFYFNRESGKPCGVATFDVPLLAFEFSDLGIRHANAYILRIPQITHRTGMWYQLHVISLAKTRMKRGQNQVRSQCFPDTRLYSVHRYTHHSPLQIFTFTTLPHDAHTGVRCSRRWILYQEWQWGPSPLL